MYDRALKDLGGKGWLGLCDLERISGRVNEEFEVVNNVANNVGDEYLGSHTQDNHDVPSTTSDGDSSNSSVPKTERPSCAEYTLLCERAKVIFNEIKTIPIESQMRRRIKNLAKI